LQRDSVARVFTGMTRLLIRVPRFLANAASGAVVAPLQPEVKIVKVVKNDTGKLFDWLPVPCVFFEIWSSLRGCQVRISQQLKCTEAAIPFTHNICCVFTFGIVISKHSKSVKRIQAIASDVTTNLSYFFVTAKPFNDLILSVEWFVPGVIEIEKQPVKRDFALCSRGCRHRQLIFDDGDGTLAHANCFFNWS